MPLILYIKVVVSNGKRGMPLKIIKDSTTKNKDKKVAEQAYSVSMPIIDRMADKGLIHKNKAARHKSRLNSKIKAL